MTDTLSPADRLTRSEKRELGILPRQLMAYGVRLKKDGVDLATVESRLEQCYLLIGEAVEEYPAAWSNPKAIDWDAVLAFIERLIPLILQIIALF